MLHNPLRPVGRPKGIDTVNPRSNLRTGDGSAGLPHGGAPRVAVWRADLLRGSETFVRNQLTSLQRWRGRAFGLTRFESPLSDPSDVTLFGAGIAGKLRRRLFERTRRSRRLERMLQEWAPAVVHAHFVWDAALIVPTLRRLNIPLVVTAHGFDVTAEPPADSAGRRRRGRDHDVFDYATRVIAISEFIRAAAIDRGAAIDRTVVEYIGIPLDEVESAAAGPRSGILFVGRLVEKKGADVLLRAVAELPEPLRSIRLTIVGSGPQEQLLRELAHVLGLKAAFVGHRSPSEVTALLDAALVFCVPSRRAASGDSEGLGMVFLEAASRGAVVVSTRHGGIPEAVIDGETGYLVEEDRADLLADALSLALTDDVERERRAAAALERVHREFDIQRCTEALERVYDQAAGRSPGEPQVTR